MPQSSSSPATMAAAAARLRPEDEVESVSADIVRSVALLESGVAVRFPTSYRQYNAKVQAVHDVPLADLDTFDPPQFWSVWVENGALPRDMAAVARFAYRAHACGTARPVPIAGVPDDDLSVRSVGSSLLVPKAAVLVHVWQSPQAAKRFIHHWSRVWQACHLLKTGGAVCPLYSCRMYLNGDCVTCTALPPCVGALDDPHSSPIDVAGLPRASMTRYLYSSVVAMIGIAKPPSTSLTVEKRREGKESAKNAAGDENGVEADGGDVPTSSQPTSTRTKSVTLSTDVADNEGGQTTTRDDGTLDSNAPEESGAYDEENDNDADLQETESPRGGGADAATAAGAVRADGEVETTTAAAATEANAAEGSGSARSRSKKPRAAGRRGKSSSASPPRRGRSGDRSAERKKKSDRSKSPSTRRQKASKSAADRNDAAEVEVQLPDTASLFPGTDGRMYVLRLADVGLVGKEFTAIFEDLHVRAELVSHMADTVLDSSTARTANSTTHSPESNAASNDVVARTLMQGTTSSQRGGGSGSAGVGRTVTEPLSPNTTNRNRQKSFGGELPGSDGSTPVADAPISPPNVALAMNQHDGKTTANAPATSTTAAASPVAVVTPVSYVAETRVAMLVIHLLDTMAHRIQSGGRGIPLPDGTFLRTDTSDPEVTVAPASPTRQFDEALTTEEIATFTAKNGRSAGLAALRAAFKSYGVNMRFLFYALAYAEEKRSECAAAMDKEGVSLCTKVAQDMTTDVLRRAVLAVGRSILSAAKNGVETEFGESNVITMFLRNQRAALRKIDAELLAPLLSKNVDDRLQVFGDVLVPHLARKYNVTVATVRSTITLSDCRVEEAVHSAAASLALDLPAAVDGDYAGVLSSATVVQNVSTSMFSSQQHTQTAGPPESMNPQDLAATASEASAVAAAAFFTGSLLGQSHLTHAAAMQMKQELGHVGEIGVGRRKSEFSGAVGRAAQPTVNAAGAAQTGGGYGLLCGGTDEEAVEKVARDEAAAKGADAADVRPVSNNSQGQNRIFTPSQGQRQIAAGAISQSLRAARKVPTLRTFSDSDADAAEDDNDNDNGESSQPQRVDTNTTAEVPKRQDEKQYQQGARSVFDGLARAMFTVGSVVSATPIKHVRLLAREALLPPTTLSKISRREGSPAVLAHAYQFTAACTRGAAFATKSPQHAARLAMAALIKAPAMADAAALDQCELALLTVAEGSERLLPRCPQITDKDRDATTAPQTTSNVDADSQQADKEGAGGESGSLGGGGGVLPPCDVAWVSRALMLLFEVRTIHQVFGDFSTLRAATSVIRRPLVMHNEPLDRLSAVHRYPAVVIGHAQVHARVVAVLHTKVAPSMPQTQLVRPCDVLAECMGDIADNYTAAGQQSQGQGILDSFAIAWAARAVLAPLQSAHEAVTAFAEAALGVHDAPRFPREGSVTHTWIAALCALLVDEQQLAPSLKIHAGRASVAAADDPDNVAALDALRDACKKIRTSFEKFAEANAIANGSRRRLFSVLPDLLPGIAAAANAVLQIPPSMLHPRAGHHMRPLLAFTARLFDGVSVPLMQDVQRIGRAFVARRKIAADRKTSDLSKVIDWGRRQLDEEWKRRLEKQKMMLEEKRDEARQRQWEKKMQEGKLDDDLGQFGNPEAEAQEEFEREMSPEGSPSRLGTGGDRQTPGKPTPQSKRRAPRSVTSAGSGASSETRPGTYSISGRQNRVSMFAQGDDIQWNADGSHTNDGGINFVVYDSAGQYAADPRRFDLASEEVNDGLVDLEDGDLPEAPGAYPASALADLQNTVRAKMPVPHPDPTVPAPVPAMMGPWTAPGVRAAFARAQETYDLARKAQKTERAKVAIENKKMLRATVADEHWARIKLVEQHRDELHDLVDKMTRRGLRVQGYVKRKTQGSALAELEVMAGDNSPEALYEMGIEAREQLAVHRAARLIQTQWRRNCALFELRFRRTEKQFQDRRVAVLRCVLKIQAAFRVGLAKRRVRQVRSARAEAKALIAAEAEARRLSKAREEMEEENENEQDDDDLENEV